MGLHQNQIALAKEVERLEKRIDECKIEEAEGDCPACGQAVTFYPTDIYGDWTECGCAEAEADYDEGLTEEDIERINEDPS